MDVTRFKIRFPEFANTDNDTVQMFLEESMSQVNARLWGPLYSLAVGLLAAHSLAVALRGSSGAAGPVTSESVGDISRSYAAGGGGIGGPLGNTGYGLEYARLMKSLTVSPMVL